MKKIDIEELYWSDFGELEKDEEKLKEVFDYLEEYGNRTIEELSQIITLYSNPSGAFTLDFAKIIGNYYKNDKLRFIKALNLVKDEIGNLVYVFRNLKIFEDEDEEEKQILESKELSPEEVETGEDFFKMYRKICTS